MRAEGRRRESEGGRDERATTHPTKAIRRHVKIAREGERGQGRRERVDDMGEGELGREPESEGG